MLGDQKVTTEVEGHVSLKQQNSDLRYVISEMRRKMEAMSSDVIKDEEPATIAIKSVPLNSGTFQTGSLCMITQVILSSLLKVENCRLLSNLENEKLVKLHQDRNHHKCKGWNCK